MKKIYQLIKPRLFLIGMSFIALASNGQIRIQSNATAEAASNIPDQVADVPADSKIRLTSDDSETYEAFVKFDVSTVNADKLSNVSIITSAGQHNPSGTPRIDPYWVDMYGSTVTDWPDPFTWNSSRIMDKSDDVLASENVQAQAGGYTFSGEEVVDWIKARKGEGATEVTFRFHAREEHPFGIWVNGTYQDGMQMLIEYAEIPDDPASYTDTIVKINFAFDASTDQAGWVNVYGSSSFPADLGDGVSISVSGSTLQPGSSGEPTTILPANVGSTYNFVDQSEDNPVDFVISGLDPEEKYQFGFFASRDGSSASGDRTTYFYIRNSMGKEDGEFLIYDEEFTYNESLNGFKWFNTYDIEDYPSDWTAPYDYEQGEIFERYEVIDQPTDTKAFMSFGFWQDDGTGFVRESLSSQTSMNGPGTVGYRNSSPSVWWEYDEENPMDFSDPDAFTHIGFPFWSDNVKIVSPWVTNSDWDRRDLFYPFTVRASIVAVAEGQVFSGWEYWLNRDREVSINPVGNADSLLIISAITPNQDGEVKINMSKLVNNYGYINAMLIMKQGVTSSKDVAQTNGIKCFPVPTVDQLTVSGLSGSGFVSVYDLVGHKVSEIQVSKSEVNLEMGHLKSGLYLVRISDSNLSVIKNFKIVKN